MTTFSLEGIENIIFDLGMVIIDLEMDETTNSFKELFKDEYEEVFNQLNKEGHFEKYEKGEISTNDFIEGINSYAKTNQSHAISTAWNAMLKKIPEERFDILNFTKSRYRTFCLSNTNELHIEFIYDYLQREKKIDNFNRYFEKVYLSHEIKMRKPDPEIFEYVLNQNKLDPSKTLFIDDTAGHLVGAISCGIKSYHLKEGEKLEDLIKLNE